MNFNFDFFVKDIHQEFEEQFDIEQVHKLLELDENSYNFDSPISRGKRLIINKVSVYGKKSEDSIKEYAGHPINFSHPFDKGVNMIIADNLKGKSSIFKAIKFALTGSDDIKSDVKKWIDLIFVNFSINEKEYTSYLDISSRILNAYLYKGNYCTRDEIESSNIEPIFDANSKDSFQEKMNKFFFNQLSYYSLKWTQKSPSKESTDLISTGTSWKSYFKSIFLESKDSSDLIFGAQGKKVLQMLLGIELTYPINRLTVKKDIIQNTKGKVLNQHKQNKGHQYKEELERELKKITQNIEEIEKISSKQINLAPLYKQHNDISNIIEIENKKAWDAQKNIDSVQQKINKITTKGTNIKNEIKRLKQELTKAIKQQNDIQEYLEIGVLFSNLNIKYCPSCNHDVSEKIKMQKDNKSSCSLCNQGIQHTHTEDKQSFHDKLDNLSKTINNLKNTIQLHEVEITQFRKEYAKTKNEKQKIEKQKPGKQNLLEYRKQIEVLDKKINEQRRMIPTPNVNKELLIANRAVIKYKLEEAQKEKTTNVELYDKQIKLLSFAIDKLSNKRLENGKKILDKLTKVMLDELHTLGLNTIEAVYIKNNFEISYKQNGELVNFDNIAEGEQLRAKLALYLSLMQLDIDFNFSHHPRLLIIDSPGKEEGDDNYLNGLVEILKGIEDRLGDQLQIIIGTAERKLKGVVKPEKETVFPPETYVF